MNFAFRGKKVRIIGFLKEKKKIRRGKKVGLLVSQIDVKSENLISSTT